MRKSVTLILIQLKSHQLKPISLIWEVIWVILGGMEIQLQTHLHLHTNTSFFLNNVPGFD